MSDAGRHATPALPEGVNIRVAELADAPALARLRTAMFEDMHAAGGLGLPWSEDEREARVREAEQRFLGYVAEAMPAGRYRSWLAEAGGENIGSAALAMHRLPPTPGNLDGTRAHVLSVYVSPEWRRRGIARAMMTAALEWAEAEGVGLVTLRPTEKGEPLYEQLGFWSGPEMRRYLR